MEFKFFDLNESQTIIINQNEDMKAALTLLEASALKILLVVSVDKAFMGVLTDGDIRTALLNGCDLSTKIQLFMNSDFISVSNEEELIKLEHQNKDISEFPCVNSLGEVQGLFVRKKK